MRPFNSTLAIILGFSLLTGCGAETSNHLKDFGDQASNICLQTKVGSISIPAGLANIGSDRGYPEERPIRSIRIQAFDMDATEVTNAQFASFVEATGYVTSAEKTQPGFDTSGAAVFTPPDAVNPSWWVFVQGANWRHPEGPDSSIDGREDDPVVQVSHEDASAYADWKGRALPSEEQWEYAAKAGSETRYIWGETRTLDDAEQANTWQGAFPIENTNEDGFLRRAPVGCFTPNKWGLYDMIGNVWEWTDTVYQASETEPTYTLKGGSFLCAENFCQRYRAAAKQSQEAGFPTNHIGFRTVNMFED